MVDERRALLLRSDVKLAGPGMLMHGTALALEEVGWAVQIASGGGALEEKFRHDGLNHRYIPGLNLNERSPVQLLKGALQLRRILNEGEINLVHSFNAQAGLLAWLASRGLKISIVNTVLGAGMEHFLPYMPFHLLAVSNYTRNDLIAHRVRPDRVSVVHNAIIPQDRILSGRDEFDRLWAKRERAHGLRIVGVAMMNGDKGQKMAIEALGHLLALAPEIDPELTLVGDGLLRPQLEKLALDTGLSERVHFVGAQADVYPFLDDAHLFLHLSPAETFGMVLAEAHARGLPVISQEVGGIPEVVENGISGVLAKPGDLPAVVQALWKIGTDRNLLRTMGWAGLQRTSAMFTRDKLGKRLSEIYSTL